MYALHLGYPKVDARVLRKILLHYDYLYSRELLASFNAQASFQQLDTCEALTKVLKPQMQIVETHKAVGELAGNLQTCDIVRALVSRYRDKPFVRKVGKLTLTEFKSFCQLNKDGDKAALLELIRQSEDPTFFRPAVFQQVKGQTSLTKTELDEVENWVKSRIAEGDADLKGCYDKVEATAKALAESHSRDAYFKPKPYQKFIAA